MSPAGLLNEPEPYERVARLAALDRPSASPGELAAAELIAGELRGLGARVRVERERVHGTHWWPTGVADRARALRRPPRRPRRRPRPPARRRAGRDLGRRRGRRSRRREAMPAPPPLPQLGTAISASYAAAFVDIGLRATVPGANDNLTGVAAVLSLAHAIAAAGGPPNGVRVILLSAGAEESHQEGMSAFAERHFPSPPTESTHVICLDTLGSPRLAALEGKGMLRMEDYPEAVRDLVERCAEEAGVDPQRGLRFRNPTDGLIALRAGYPCAAIVSVDEFKVPTDYHWPTDTADYARVADAARQCVRLVERLAPERDAAAAEGS